MHPILVKRARLALYMAAWIPLAALLALVLSAHGGIDAGAALALAFPLAFLYAFICLAAWYLCRAASLHGGFWRRAAILHLVAGIVSSGIWTAAGTYWAGELGRGGLGSDLGRRFADQRLLVWSMGVLLYLLSAAGHYLIAAFEESRKAEARALELQLLAGQAELRALRAQIDPHFLFNSLNSISALAGSDPAAARRMCLLLADFLRKSLNLSERASIPLEQELALARDYLAIEQVRFGQRLSVQIELDDECRGALVPPLITQPLAENAVRHGIASLLEGGAVRIAAHRRGDGLRLTMENPCDPDSPKLNGAGMGLSLVRRRLEAHAAQARGGARLDVTRTGGIFRVEIALDAA